MTSQLNDPAGPLIDRDLGREYLAGAAGGSRPALAHAGAERTFEREGDHGLRTRAP